MFPGLSTYLSVEEQRGKSIFMCSTQGALRGFLTRRNTNGSDFEVSRCVVALLIDVF